MEIKGSVALVTGANRGIGKAFVEGLLAGGATKVYATARKPASLEETVALDPERVVPLALDVTEPDQVQAVAEQAGDVSLLLNNAGTAQFTGLIAADSMEAARLDMETNYFGALSMTRAFAPVLKANGGGAIVTVASIAAFVTLPMIGSYSASKAAAHSMIQGTRAELRSQGTLVVGVYPGPVDTEMSKGLPMDKASPRQIVRATLDAVQAGTEDVFPDPTAAGLYEQFVADPKASERQAAEMAPAA